MSDDGRVFVYSVVGFFLGIWLFYKGFVWLHLKRLIEDTPTSKVRGIAMGLVEVAGSVVPHAKLLKGPLTGNDCVYYKYEVEEYRSSGKSSRWVTVDQGVQGVQFYCKDNTGKVLVDPTNAEVDIPQDFRCESRGFKDPPKNVKAFLRTRNIKFEGWLGNKTMRYTEHHIAPKDQIFVLGSADDNPDVKPGMAKEGVENVLIHKGNHKIFYISDRKEEDIVSRFRWKMLGGLIGGALLTTACLAIILLYLGLL